MQAASLSTKTVFDMEKNAIVRSRLQLVEAMMRERNAAGAAKLAARARLARTRRRRWSRARRRARSAARRSAIDGKAGVSIAAAATPPAKAPNASWNAAHTLFRAPPPPTALLRGDQIVDRVSRQVERSCTPPRPSHTICCCWRKRLLRR